MFQMSLERTHFTRLRSYVMISFFAENIFSIVSFQRQRALKIHIKALNNSLETTGNYELPSGYLNRAI